MVAGLKAGNARADLMNHADAFVTQNAAGGAAGDIAFKYVQVGTADRGPADLDHRIGGRVDARHRPLVQRLQTRSVIDKRFHEAFRVTADSQSRRAPEDGGDPGKMPE
jgi:hypothetical protein